MLRRGGRGGWSEMEELMRSLDVVRNVCLKLYVH